MEFYGRGFFPHLVSTEDLEWDDERISEQVRIYSGMKDVNAAVVAGGGHERVVPVKARIPYSLEEIAKGRGGGGESTVH